MFAKNVDAVIGSKFHLERASSIRAATDAAVLPPHHTPCARLGLPVRDTQHASRYSSARSSNAPPVLVKRFVFYLELLGNADQRPATFYFMLATIVSVPIIIGYYHDALGDAVTTPIYDAFYRYFPGFQMFRFSYKWVAGVEFGISGLYALAVYSIVTWLREQRAFSVGTANERFGSVVPVASAVLVLLPILIFVPVLMNQDELPRYGLAELDVSRKRVGGQRRSAPRCALSDAVSRTIRLGGTPSSTSRTP